MVNAGNTLATTIATAIIGPIVGTIKKVWQMLKQGWKSLKEAISFLKDPANKNMPMSLKILEIGKIMMAGLSGVGALVLGEVIEKGLLAIPIFAIEIPLLGSLASIIGIFMGAVIAGIIGAIVINVIDKATADKRKELTTKKQVKKGNEILQKQQDLLSVSQIKYDAKKKETVDSIKSRHVEAAEFMREVTDEIFAEDSADASIDFDEMDNDFDEMDSALDKLLEE
jgi:hypothetical protein